MAFIEIFLIALGMAADAFAVSVSAGSTGTMQNSRSMFRLSFHFGLFQFLMPVLGWYAGMRLEQYVQAYDHWIASGLLLWVAFNMIKSVGKQDINPFLQDPSRGLMLVTLSFATSLDALAIGLSLAFLQISIWYPAVIIGVVTGVTSFIGIVIGKKFSKIIGRRAAVIGGILLILIGFRILLTHLFSL
jgi:putative Mn2+ efflux pump MntP